MRPDKEVLKFMNPKSGRWLQEGDLKAILDDENLKVILQGYSHDVDGVRQYIEDLQRKAKEGTLSRENATLQEGPPPQGIS